MTIAYSINGGAEIHGVYSTWTRVVKSEQLDGTVEYSPYLLNTWTVPSMLGSTFDLLTAARGEALTSLETNDFTDRNAAAIYADAILQTLEAKEHQGRNLFGVTVEFLVNV